MRANIISPAETVNDQVNENGRATTMLNRRENKIIDADERQAIRARVQEHRRAMELARQTPIVEVDD